MSSNLFSPERKRQAEWAKLWQQGEGALKRPQLIIYNQTKEG